MIRYGSADEQEKDCAVINNELLRAQDQARIGRIMRPVLLVTGFQRLERRHDIIDVTFKENGMTFNIGIIK
jgi:hypothetical protein